jgi:hypothetical protein
MLFRLSVLPTLGVGRAPCRDQSNPPAPPRVRHHEHPTERVSPQREHPRLVDEPDLVLQGERPLVLEDRRIGEVDPLIASVDGGVAGVPFELAHCMYTCTQTQGESVRRQV